VLSGERYSMVPKEVKDYVKGLYGKPPAPIDEQVKKTIIGDEKVIRRRPADMLKPEVESIPKKAKQFIESDEDALTYVLFPQTATEFFKKRKLKREETVRSLPSPLERQEFEEVAAVSTALAEYLTSRGEVVAVIPVRRLGRPSPWSMAGRQEQMGFRG